MRKTCFTFKLTGLENRARHLWIEEKEIHVGKRESGNNERLGL